MKILVLKNKFILILFFLLFNQKNYSQNCSISLDSVNVEKFGFFNEMLSDSILNQYLDKQICIIYFTNRLYNPDYFIIYNDNDSLIYIDYTVKGKTYKKEEKSFISFFPGYFLPYNGTYFLYSEIFSRNYYDFYFFKYYNNCFQIAPSGTTIIQNILCLKNYNEILYNNFNSFYWKYKTITDIKK
jgi:hypothetical protein